MQGDNGPGGRITLEAANDLAAGAAKATAQLVCSCSGKQAWADRVGGCVVALAGNQHFSAVGLLDGSLLVRPLSALSLALKIHQCHLSESACAIASAGGFPC